MKFRNKVYLLTEILDDPRFEGFAGEVFLDGGLPRHRGKVWKKVRLLPTWKPVRVFGRVRKFNDFPCVDLMPAFSARAVDALRDYLEPNGELLPLVTPVGSYFAYNVTTIVNALDLKRSLIKWTKKPFTAFEVERYEFIEEELDGRSIFHIPQTAADVYVTEAFVQRANEYGLRGMDFQKVWPFPPGVEWWRVAKRQRDKHDAKGLPKGQTVKGNSILIRLFLANKKSKGSGAEQKALARLLDELDALLVDGESSEPVIGNLEGVDHDSPGEFRVFLSCPDAKVLAKKLRAWLRKLRWPSGFVAFKRYGNFADLEAPEEPIKI